MARRILFALTLLFCASPAAAQGAGDAAAQAFDRGDFDTAAERYTILLQTRGADAPLLYNLGTSAAEGGDWGRAVWALERAHLRAPSDPDIAHNLAVVRQRVRVDRMKNLTHERLTDGEPDGAFAFRAATALPTWATAAAVLVFNLLLIFLLVLRRKLRDGGARDGATVLAGGLALLLLLLLAAAAAQLLALSELRLGVVLAAEQRLASTPSATADARPHADLYRGAVVRVLEARSDGWTHIRLVDGTAGWVRDNHVGLIQEDALP